MPKAYIDSLSDADDDVRSVSAACLLPIANRLVTKLSTPEVQVLLHVLWDCLSEGGDELGSSTGVVMDLLGEYSPLLIVCADNPGKLITTTRPLTFSAQLPSTTRM